MNSKRHLYPEAERLYIYNYMAVDSIANKLNVNRKTILAWKEEGDWTNRRKEYLKSKQSFHEELYEFARKLMQGISEDMAAGEKIDPGRMYAFCRVLPMFTKVMDYEDATAKKVQKEKPKGLTADIIAQIEEEVLGIQRINKPPIDLNDNDKS